MATMTKQERRALMADAVNEADGAEPIDLPESAHVPDPVVVKPVPVAPSAAPDLAAMVQMLAAALQQSGTGTADAIKEALSDQARTARAPIAETYLSGGYPAKSVFSHPDGDDQHPRTVVRCPMFLGVHTEKGETIPAFEIYPDVCTEPERVLLNQLTPGIFPVERNDGKLAHWRVVQQSDDLGQPIRMVIAMPATWLSKAEQAQMPSQMRFLTQLTSGSAA